MSTARFPCERCGGSGLAPDGLVCAVCTGRGWTVPRESPGDALRDWESRNAVSLVLAFIAAVVGWLWLGVRWVRGDTR